ncbi:hypothetical protein [Enterovibrio norvegicus]|uniref:hypothetical protein n=1 Tax=Enterovibrio norvegicus TaxID=188144 RepID=UPI0024B1BFEE|nr:hypothetical protein [Enterovibrio norvegicus]
MGGSSKSDSTNTTVTSTTNKSLSQAVGGDNTGVMLSGIEDADINLTMTDMGAMAVAGHMAEEAFAFGADTLNTHESLVRDVFDVGVRALTTNTETSQHAMDAMQSLAGQQHATTQAAIHLAEGAKAREQTGATDSNNTLLKNVSLMVGVVGTIITVVYLLRGSH